jgi:hypothetical protein
MSRALESGGIAERRKNLLVGLTGEVLDIGAGTSRLRPLPGHRHPGAGGGTPTPSRALAAAAARAVAIPVAGLHPRRQRALLLRHGSQRRGADDDRGPSGPLMTVEELSRRTGVPLKALREYTIWGLIYNLGRSGANYGLYDDEALRCVQGITELRGLGLTCRRPVACLPGRSGHDRAVTLQGLPPPWPGMLVLARAISSVGRGRLRGGARALEPEQRATQVVASHVYGF